MTGVAAVAHELARALWARRFTLGAIVSPTDALAVPRSPAASVCRGGSSRSSRARASSTTARRSSSTRLPSARPSAADFSPLHVGAHLVLNVIGGVAIGLGVGFVVRQVRSRIDDPPIEVAIAVITGYLAYLPASALGVSGVLAAVTVGVYMGWYTPELTTVETRLSGNAFWEILTFLVNALLFVLVGLQLQPIVNALVRLARLRRRRRADLRRGDPDPDRLGADLHLRPAVPLPERPRARPYPPWQAPPSSPGRASGAACRLRPHWRSADRAFPDRDLILFVTFCVLVATLIFQGMTLPALIAPFGYPRTTARRGRTRRRGSRRPRRRSPAWTSSSRKASSPDSAVRLRGAYGFRHRPLPGAARRRGRRRGRGALTATSACAASCSPPSEARSSRCETRANQRRSDEPRATRHRPRGLPSRCHAGLDGVHDDAPGPGRLAATTR